MALAIDTKQTEAVTGLYDSYMKLYDYRNSSTSSPSADGSDIEMDFVGVVQVDNQDLWALSNWKRKESDAICERKSPDLYKQLENKVDEAREQARSFDGIDISILSIQFLRHTTVPLSRSVSDAAVRRFTAAQAQVFDAIRETHEELSDDHVVPSREASRLIVVATSAAFCDNLVKLKRQFAKEELQEFDKLLSVFESFKEGLLLSTEKGYDDFRLVEFFT